VPDVRAILIALSVGGGVGGYLTLWWHWPFAIGWGIGIVLGGLALIGTMSVATDSSIADRAWRAAAPDLQDPPAEPGPDIPIRPPEPTRPLEPPRSRDLPSGD
jgi:hypothetical protein